MIAAAGGSSGRAAGASGSDADWGFSSGSKGMARETKIGLALILVLLCAFGFVVYKKVHSENDLLAGTAEAGRSEAQPSDGSGATGAGTTQSGSDRGRGESAYDDAPPFAGQTEPGMLEIDENEPPRPARSAAPTRWAGDDEDDLAQAARQPHGGNHATEPDDATSNPFSSHEDEQREHALEQLAQAGRQQSDGAAGETEQPFGSDLDRPFDPAQHSASRSPAHSGRPAADAKGTTASDSAPERLAGDRGAVDDADREAGAFDGGNQEQNSRQQPPGSAAEDLFPGDAERPDGDQRYGGYRAVQSGAVQAESATVVRHPESEPEPGDGIEQTAAESPFGQLEPRPYDDPVQMPQGGGVFGTQRSFDPKQRGGEGTARSQTGEGGSQFFEADAGAASESDRPDVVAVQSGDNYWTISKRQYGTPRYFTALARYNSRRIPDPRKMRPGMKVLAPGKEVLEARYPDLFPGRANGEAAGSVANAPPGFFQDAQGRPMYRVGRRDTLTEIAHRHLGRASRWRQIFEMNRDRIKNPADLKIGTELRLPADASRVRLVRTPPQVR